MTRRGEISVDEVLSEWAVARPDLDASPIRIFTAIVQAGRMIEEFYESSAARHGILGSDFFLLASLRRIGEPFAATPGELSGLLVRSTGGMTKQIDRIEAAGLIERQPNPQDRRSSVVRLTSRGLELIDRALEQHFGAEADLLVGLAPGEIDTSISVLRTMMRNLRSSSADDD